MSVLAGHVHAQAEPPQAESPQAESQGVETPAGPEAVAAPATAAPAEDASVQEARERIARASELYEQENYDAALAEFHEVLDLIGVHPVRFQVLYNIARSYEALYRYDKAMDFYGRFLDEGGRETALATEVSTKVQVLQGLLGTILIEVRLLDYEVWVDDRLVGERLDRVMVPGGTHVVEVRAEGYVPNQREVQVPARAERSVSFELQELAEEYEGLPSYLFWGATGAATLAAVGGAIFGILAIKRHNELDDMFDEPYGGLGLVRQEDVDDVADLARNADIFFGAALLLGTAAVIFAFFTDWEDDDDPDAASPVRARLRFAPAVGRDSAGLWLEGSF